MSIILVRTEQEYSVQGLMSFAPMSDIYAFAIDLGHDLPIKRRLKFDQTMNLLNAFAETNKGFMSNLEPREINYSGGSIRLINFLSPCVDSEQLPEYKEKIMNCLLEMNPVLVGEDVLDRIQNTDTEKLGPVMLDIEQAIFKVSRERKKLLNASLNASKDPAAKPQSKI